MNNLHTDGVSVHWHGLDVPNAEDSVPGVTQNAVPPGRSHTYRFVAEQVGTCWFHTHQHPAALVARGLFDTLVVLQRCPFPGIPTLVVREGDLVKVRFINRGHDVHPMHLHGHYALVLSRNGRPVSGSPWWTDTLDVAPGESYEIAFRADNPAASSPRSSPHCRTRPHPGSARPTSTPWPTTSSPTRARSRASSGITRGSPPRPTRR